MKLNRLEQYFETNENDRIVNFTQVNADGDTPLMYALIFNKSKKINLTNKQLEYLIKNSDLTQINIENKNALAYALDNNKFENLNLTNKQLDYLIKNSDLKQVDFNKLTPLMYALIFNKSQNLNLTNEQWKYMINNSDLSLIKEDEKLIELRKIQSELMNEEILSKINIKEKINKKVKI